MCPPVVPSTCLLSIFSLSSYPSFDLSLDVRMGLAKHRSVYVSIDLVARLSIDLAIKSHGIYSLLCFQNRCLPEGSLRYFPSSAALFQNSTSQTPKVVRTWCVLDILTSKSASRHNGVHFFETRHLRLQKWSEHAVFCAF